MNDITENTKLLTENEIFFTAFEPKTRNRFMVKLVDMNGKEVLPTWLIKAVTRPESRWSDNKSWVWMPITMGIYDPILPSATQILYAYMMENSPSLFNMSITLLGPVGDTVEKWEIKNAKFSEIDFGSLDWASYPENGKSSIESHNLSRPYKGGVATEITATITFETAELLF